MCQVIARRSPRDQTRSRRRKPQVLGRKDFADWFWDTIAPPTATAPRCLLDDRGSGPLYSLKIHHKALTVKVEHINRELVVTAKWTTHAEWPLFNHYTKLTFEEKFSMRAH